MCFYFEKICLSIMKIANYILEIEKKCDILKSERFILTMGLKLKQTTSMKGHILEGKVYEWRNEKGEGADCPRKDF